MISEKRLIGFSDDAVLAAVRLFAPVAERQPKIESVERIWLKTAAPLVLAAQVREQGADQPSIVLLSASEVTAYLMLLCRRERIPLPKDAEKMLRLENGQLSLLLSRKIVDAIAPPTQTEQGALEPAMADRLGAPSSWEPVSFMPAGTFEYSSLTVLVVEDEDFQRGLLVRLLEELPVAEVYQARDGLHAIDVLQQIGQSPDVIICDLEMPGLDGFTLVERVRQGFTAAATTTPMLVLSVYRLAGIVDDALARGADGYLVKPVSRIELTELLEQVVTARRSEA